MRIEIAVDVDPILSEECCCSILRMGLDCENHTEEPSDRHQVDFLSKNFPQGRMSRPLSQ